MKKPRQKSVTGSGTIGAKRGKGRSVTGRGTVRGKGRSVSGHGTIGGTPKRGSVTGTGTIGAKKAPKPAKTPKKRAWSPGMDVACCSAEALGFLLGWDAATVLDLYWRTCSDPDEGASILDTLRAARADVAPVPEALQFAVHSSGSRPRLPGTSRESTWGGFILGLSLPEPHAVAVTPDGRWHSWGEPFNPAGWPELEIDEAWAVLL